MKFLVLNGSLRKNGNTAEILKPFCAALRENGAEVSEYFLADMNINPCRSCFACQRVTDAYGCVQNDDMQAIVDEIISADVIVLATPIHTWYCPVPMKAFLDRHFGLNKYYGKQRGSLWAGKKMALILTHGYTREFAIEPFVMGIQRLCEHSKLDYMGEYCVRDKRGLESFRSEEAVAGAREFASKLINA